MSLESYIVLSLTQHWRRIGPVWYRDAYVRTPAGRTELVSIREDLLDGGDL